MSLRSVSAEASLDEPHDKTNLSVLHQKIESGMRIAEGTVDREWRACQGINASQRPDGSRDVQKNCKVRALESAEENIKLTATDAEEKRGSFPKSSKNSKPN